MKHIYVIYCKEKICYVGKAKDMARRWRNHKSYQSNPTSTHYDLKISQYMREKGWNNFEMGLLETVADEHASQAEGSWYWTFKDLGIDLKNDREPGIGRNVKGTICYENCQARNREKIPCEKCGKMISRSNLRRHQRRSNCI